MNKDFILDVANAIEMAADIDAAKTVIPGLGFNMDFMLAPVIPKHLDVNDPNDAPYIADYRADRKDNTGHDCGTVACVAGWTVALDAVKRGDKGLKTIEGMGSREVEQEARRLLDLSYEDAHDLFFPPATRQFGRIKPEDAVKTLRHLAEAGEVAWHLHL